MTDPELLELAAKAAKLCYTWRPFGGFVEYSDGPRPWNPLLDDGDALRLAVKLGFRMTIWPTGCEINGGQTDSMFISLDQAEDCVYAATRRAIVLAAAEIGKVMNDYKS